jgi:hypothetical protein
VLATATAAATAAAATAAATAAAVAAGVFVQDSTAAHAAHSALDCESHSVVGRLYTIVAEQQ